MSRMIRISDFNASDLDVYARLNEAQLLHYYEPSEGLFIAESPKVIERALAAGHEPVSFLMEEKHITGAKKRGISHTSQCPIYMLYANYLYSTNDSPVISAGFARPMRSRTVSEMCSGATFS